MSEAPIINTSTYASAPRWVQIEWFPLQETPTRIVPIRTPTFTVQPPGPQTSTSFTDQNAQPDTTYTYRICALYGTDQACSQDVQLHTPPLPATGSPDPPWITAANVAADSIEIVWTADRD